MNVVDFARQELSMHELIIEVKPLIITRTINFGIE